MRKPEGKRPLERRRRRRVDNINMNYRDRMVWTVLFWFRIGTGKKALVSTLMNLRVPKSVAKFFSSYTTFDLSGTVNLHGVTRRSALINSFAHADIFLCAENMELLHCIAFLN
jgi:hypothetical protein